MCRPSALPDQCPFAAGDLLQIGGVRSEVLGPAAGSGRGVFIEQVACRRVHRGPPRRTHSTRAKMAQDGSGESDVAGQKFRSSRTNSFWRRSSALFYRRAYACGWPRCGHFATRLCTGLHGFAFWPPATACCRVAAGRPQACQRSRMVTPIVPSSPMVSSLRRGSPHPGGGVDHCR